MPLANLPANADYLALLPFSIVALTPLLILFLDLFFRGNGQARRAIAVGLAIVGLVVAGLVEVAQYPHGYAAFGGAFIQGGFSIVFSEIVIIATIATLMLSIGIGRDDQVAGTTALVLWSASGAMLMSGAGNLMMVFLGLELLSLALYCLCAISSRPTARESALKYLILSSMASGFLLYGSALLFGATGSVAFSALATATVTPLLALGAGLFLIGLAFKLSLVPFHTWTPDVYEGAPLPVTAFMSVATKAGTLAVLARFAYAALPAERAAAILAPLWVLAALSMLIGNLGALAQTDMKRLLAYSGIAQVGYIVAAFAGTSTLGLRYAILYLAGYTFMNLGAFAVVALLSRDGDAVVGLPRFAGLAHRRPWLAAAMTFFLIGLAGLPPTIGFTGKILILAVTVGAGYAWLGGVLILSTAISAYVYFKIVRVMFAQVDPKHVRDERSANALPWVAVAVCAAATFILGLVPLTPSNVLPLVK
ncbi:MAG: NADH:ubiquinone oxidoreductase, rane subunit [Candidatus Eremiobacteraeota bacterium]|nr:NADH:ubiquinone oxidoreductase, rane subunit [Candidatus Eremiobacteraeota bacterium]